MKKIIILLLLTSTIYAKKTTPSKSKKNRHQSIQTIPTKQPPCTTKKKPLLQRGFTKVISDVWDVIITHAKRWYTALAILLVIWYKSGAPFPFRNKIASYFQ